METNLCDQDGHVVIVKGSLDSPINPDDAKRKFWNTGASIMSKVLQTLRVDTILAKHV